MERKFRAKWDSMSGYRWENKNEIKVYIKFSFEKFIFSQIFTPSIFSCGEEVSKWSFRIIQRPTGRGPKIGVITFCGGQRGPCNEQLNNVITPSSPPHHLNNLTTTPTPKLFLWTSVCLLLYFWKGSYALGWYKKIIGRASFKFYFWWIFEQNWDYTSYDAVVYY